MTIPSIQFTTAGLVVPTETSILTGVQSDINTAFGGNLNPALNTPQGQIASSETAVIADKNAQIAAMVNQTDPDFASGRFQDAIGKLYFMTRKPATATTTTVTCFGANGTVIPVGTLCIDSVGNKYQSTVAATIPSGGSIAVSFECTTLGPIALALNDLTIYQSILGWDSMTNTLGITGTNVESRADFEYRRRNSVAANAQGSLESVLGEVFAVAGVTDAYVTENDTGSPILIGATNYSLDAHSLYVAASGGVAADIAAAIYRKKAPGCNTSGNTAVTVMDTVNYAAPYPSYTINFETPAALPIKYLVQIQNNSNLPANITQLVQNAIIAAFNGTDGGQRARIGATIYSGRYYSGIAAVSPFVNILNLFVGTGAPTPSATSVAVGIDQRPTISASDITVSLI